MDEVKKFGLSLPKSCVLKPLLIATVDKYLLLEQEKVC